MPKPRFPHLLAVAMLLAACATDSSTGAPPSRPPRDGARGGWNRGDMMPDGLDLTLPASWWHESALAEPLALTGEQFQKLDALQPQEGDVARLDRDSAMAFRELRTAFEAKNAAAQDIIAAGSHLRELRQALLDRQIAMLAAQREILTLDQWTLLQRELASENRAERRGGGERGSGGRGRGTGGRGRGMGGGRRGW
jgi:hypothetical protein